MIGRIRGILIEKQPPLLCVELASGLAYAIECPMSTIYQIPAVGKEVVLYTHLTVREDAQLLYGFRTARERFVFRALIKISGVGPKLALSILSSFEPDAFITCVNNGDASSLVKVPGVGKKTAERLVVEMRDRLSSESLVSDYAGPTFTTEGMQHSPQQEAISGLVALGYKPQEASKAITKYDISDLSCEEIIRKVLQGAMV